MTKRNYETLWQELFYRIRDESDCCSQAQYCVDRDTYLDATARMEAYDHVLKIMREMRQFDES